MRPSQNTASLEGEPYWYTEVDPIIWKEHCIQHEPLELDVEIWNLCDLYPDLYSLILTDSDGGPVEIPGDQLVQMRKQERLALYPATYRLVYREEDSLQTG